MIAALLVIAAVWLVAGWWTSRSSRRAARLWAAAALTALAAANATQIAQSPGPWWPLIDWPWQAAEWLAVLLWIAAVVLVFRAREPARKLGLVLLTTGIAAFAVGTLVSSSNRASHSGQLCLGQVGKIGPWTAQLRELNALAGPDHTAIAAKLSLNSGIAKPAEARTQQRDYIVGAGSRLAGSDTVSRLNGELLVSMTSIPAMRECITLRLEWRPFAQWLRYGAWLALAGANVLLLAAIRSVWWRTAARERIAMRRADQRRRALPLGRDRLAWQPLVAALACGVAALAWQQWQRPALGPVAKSAADGPAMIAARRSPFSLPRHDNRWIVTADALARNGRFADAAGMLLGATKQQPGNAEAWLAMGDALYGHAGGRMTPAAELAYVRADRAATQRGKQSSLTAEAMARSGRTELAQAWLVRIQPGTAP